MADKLKADLQELERLGEEHLSLLIKIIGDMTSSQDANIIAIKMAYSIVTATEKSVRFFVESAEDMVEKGVKEEEYKYDERSGRYKLALHREMELISVNLEEGLDNYK